MDGLNIKNYRKREGRARKMHKVSENIDLSRKVLDIDVESPVFSEMLDNLNEEIQRAIKKVYDKEFESGEIALKLTIEIPKAFKTFAKADEFGETINEMYSYRSPKFKHNITTTLKKQFKSEGTYAEEREVQFEDGKFVVVPVKLKDPQMSIADI